MLSFKRKKFFSTHIFVNLLFCSYFFFPHSYSTLCKNWTVLGLPYAFIFACLHFFFLEGGRGSNHYQTMWNTIFPAVYRCKTKLTYSPPENLSPTHQPAFFHINTHNPVNLHFSPSMTMLIRSKILSAASLSREVPSFQQMKR